MKKVILLFLFSITLGACFGQNQPAELRLSAGSNFFTGTNKTAFTPGWGFSAAYSFSSKGKSTPEISLGYNRWNARDKNYAGMSLFNLQFGYRVSLARSPLYVTGRIGLAYNPSGSQFYFNPSLGLGYQLRFKNGSGLDLKAEYQVLQGGGTGVQGFFQPSVGYIFRLQ